MRLGLFGFVIAVALASAPPRVHAGPVLISGINADAHGAPDFRNPGGWKFISLVFSQLAATVMNGNRTIVCLGCNEASEARAAFEYTTSIAGLGRFATSLTSIDDITAYFADTGSTRISDTGILYLPTPFGYVGGGISDDQLAVVNRNGAAIARLLAAGGGLFAQEESTTPAGYGWMQALLPGFQAHGDAQTPVVDYLSLQLTAAGSARFPTLTPYDIMRTAPFHTYFTGNLGNLQTLMVGNGDGVGGVDDAVVLGGDLLGTGAIVATPEPASFALIAAGLVGLGVVRRRHAR